MLTDDPGEDPQTYACKLLEVMLLECKGRIDQVSQVYISKCVYEFTNLYL